MYQNYLPLIKSIASKYRGVVPFEDLVQEGFVGVIEAKGNFDPSKGVKFSTYAFYWIRKRISEAVRREGIQTLNSVELNEEILPGKETERYGDGASKKLDEGISKNFSSLERSVLKLHFQEEKSLSQIAEELGICREKVRQAKYLLLRKVKINQELTKDLSSVHK